MAVDEEKIELVIKAINKTDEIFIDGAYAYMDEHRPEIAERLEKYMQEVHEAVHNDSKDVREPLIKYYRLHKNLMKDFIIWREDNKQEQEV